MHVLGKKQNSGCFGTPYSEGMTLSRYQVSTRKPMPQNSIIRYDVLS